MYPSMGVIESIKSVFGDTGTAEARTYRCNECGAEFESFLAEDDFILSCEECDSDDVDPA